MNAAAELIARCLAARTTTHIDHLITPTYAQHQALGEFYDEIASAADEFAETWMGQYGKLKAKDFPTIRLSPGDPVASLTDLREWVVAHRDECCHAPGKDDNDTPENDADEDDCTDLMSLIDDMLVLINRTLYKLKFLG